MNEQLKKLGEEEICPPLAEVASLSRENADFLQLMIQKNQEATLDYYKFRGSKPSDADKVYKPVEILKNK